MTIRSRLSGLRGSLAGRPRMLTALVAVVAILLFYTAGSFAWFSYELIAGLPDRNALRSIGADMAQSTTILDANDRPVFTIFKEQRIEVPLEKMSPHLVRAVLSVEDQRFYDHYGIDAVRVGAAILRNVREGRRAEGGSTITQQLARQSFLSRDKTYRRKVKEVIVAAYLESLYSKHDILELYLNKVYFGDGFYGVEAASRGYFGKPASDLTVSEAALLAGLIQSPSSYAPTVNLERAIARRNVVLQTMVSSGAIDAATAGKNRKAEVRLTNALEIKEDSGLYFKEQVRRDLVDRFGWQRVYQGGLRVYTTMDPELQRAAETLVEKRVTEIEHLPAFPRKAMVARHTLEDGDEPDYLQGALVALDPTTGYVRAMVGGRDFDESHFNRAVQAKRQSGSAFKPFVFAAALEAGYSPASLISHLNDPIDTPQGGWVPEDEHSNASSMTLRTALRTSSNRAAVQLLQEVGIPAAVSYAERLNVGTPPSVPSLALGASEVTLMSLTAAYAAFANSGTVRQPVLIRRVEDTDGAVLYRDEATSHRAVSETTAFLMASMLADVVNAGTGYRARQTGFTLPAAGKTGTTNDFVDAWFVGFTPHIVTGVWIGFDKPRTIVPNGYAGELAVPLWAGFMRAATKNDKPDWFTPPGGVVGVNICRMSGKLPNAGCGSVEVVAADGTISTRSMVYTEYFVKGTQPTSLCALHPPRSFIDSLSRLFGGNNETPVTAAEAGLPSVGMDTGTTAAPLPVPPAKTGDVNPAGAAPSDRAEAPKKKRGFWSRLFGTGDDDSKKKKKKEEKKKPGGRP